MTRAILEYILRDVKFQDWDFIVGEKGDSFFIQPRFFARDNEDLFDHRDGNYVPVEQKGRKWLVSRYATDAEVVQTAFKAVLSAMEHEVREQFTFKGIALYGPHMDLQKLMEAAQSPRHREPVAA